MRTLPGFATRVLLACWSSLALTLAAAAAEPATSFRTDQRVPWTASRLEGTPEPPAPYRTRPAFAPLKFNEPLDMTSAPGTDRLFVVERFGKIFSFRGDGQVERADLFLDLDKVIFGLAFHPRFAENGFCYVTYLLTGEEDPLGTRVSRFRVRPGDPPRADPASEQVMLSWPSGGHNGGCLKFGPDGYLYIATGDSSGIADEKLTGQDLGNLSGAILRIDVDQADGRRAYRIPPDNPFVDLAGARGEIWAYGLRQPWKISFDRHSGDLWTGNVGQDLWEQIFLVHRGGNYGWSVMEGSHPFRPERQRGPTPFVPPIVEHDHAEFRSITGGFVYHGSRLPELRGAYIYGDYDTGKIWMFRYDRASGQVRDHRELVDSTLRLVGFAEDHAGELYLVDHMSGRLHRLEPNPAADVTVDFPRKLSETGLFASVAEHRPAAGIIPYSVHAPQWCDGAGKERFLGLPGDTRIEFDGITYPQPAPGAPHGWKFPHGTVAFETISLELEAGNPASRRRLETRILHYEQLAGSEEIGDQFWRGYTYVWNDQQTDAVLLEDAYGREQTFTIQDARAPGGSRQQTWRYPSRAECTVCHNMAAKYVLGLNTLQTNRDHDYGSGVENQLAVFERLGLFTTPLPAPPEQLPRLVDYHDTSLDLPARARSYLHANCSHCHRKWGGGNAEFRLLATVDLQEMGIAGQRPGHGGFYLPRAEILAPGDPFRSVLFYRMAKLGPGRMPRLGSQQVDPRGLELIHDWIATLPAATGNPPAPTLEAALQGLREERDHEARGRQIDQLLANTTDALRLARAIDDGKLAAALRDEIVARATRDTPAQIRDLFERFLPEQRRTKRLGNVIRPAQILALDGDVARGRQLFLKAAGVQCRNCHKIRDQGTEVGPDLSQIGKKYDRAKLLDSILDPSREIDPQYRVYLVQTAAGQLHAGLLVARDEREIVLKDAKNQQLRIPADSVEELVAQQQSLMPDLLLRDLTAQQVADLTAFLSSLK